MWNNERGVCFGELLRVTRNWVIVFQLVDLLLQDLKRAVRPYADAKKVGTHKHANQHLWYNFSSGHQAAVLGILWGPGTSKWQQHTTTCLPWDGSHIMNHGLMAKNFGQHWLDRGCWWIVVLPEQFRAVCKETVPLPCAESLRRPTSDQDDERARRNQLLSFKTCIMSKTFQDTSNIVGFRDLEHPGNNLQPRICFCA